MYKSTKVNCFMIFYYIDFKCIMICFRVLLKIMLQTASPETQCE